MIIRELKEIDIPQINILHEEYHKDTTYFPHLSTILAHGVIVEKDEVLAYGALALSGEAIMMLDLGLSNVKKGRAIKLLMRNMMKAALYKRLDKVVIFSESGILLDHLKDAYEMKEVRALIMEIDNG